MINKQFDIILFGATSFVGQIVAKHLHSLVDQGCKSVPSNFSWAIAGRNESRLKTLRNQLGDSAKDLAVFTANADNEKEITALCLQGRVIISTVGPYALYGETLVKACAETGTDYCDLTGETPWIKRMIDRYQDKAVRSRAHIVHCCGFDAIPSDLGVYFTQQQSIAQTGKACPTIKMGVKSMSGTFSGGTIASMINITKEAIADKNLRKQLADPYLLCPNNHTFKARQPNYLTVFDPNFSSWTAPFVMAGINTRIVHRSNALLNNLYGENFVYSENMLMGKKGRWRSRLLRFGMAVFAIIIALPPTRWLAQTFLLPKPGQGPSQKQQDQGSFDIRFVGLNDQKEKIATKVTGDRDPGYGSTAKMLTQAALCLAFDVDDKQAGGIVTPASILGQPLIERLNTYAGVKFSLVNK